MSKENSLAVEQNEQSRFFPISPLLLHPDTTVEFSVYLKQNNRYVLYTKEKERFNRQLKDRLFATGIKTVYVPEQQKEEFEGYVFNNLSSILSNCDIPTEERSRVFLDTSLNLINDIFQSRLPKGLTKEMLENIQHIVQSSLEFLSNKDAIKNIGKLISHDYQTFSHSVHVFVYSTAIMNRKQVSRQEIMDVGIGTLLHDIGKARIPKRILHKPGRLDKEEWELIKRHPVFGAALCSNISLPSLALMSILFHHEKFDGSGYPAEMQGLEIPWPVRVVTCCDVYDAITSERPYAPAEHPYQALRIMQNAMNGAFDVGVYKELVLMLKDADFEVGF